MSPALCVRGSFTCAVWEGLSVTCAVCVCVGGGGSVSPLNNTFATDCFL